MKLYVMNMGWEGAAICCAASMEEAREKIKQCDASFADEANDAYIEEYDLAEVAIIAAE